MQARGPCYWFGEASTGMPFTVMASITAGLATVSILRSSLISFMSNAYLENHPTGRRYFHNLGSMQAEPDS